MRRFAKVVAVACACIGSYATLALKNEAAEPERIQIEFRLAETRPAKGLLKATDPFTKKMIYLHKEAVLTNKDLAGASIEPDFEDRPALEIRLTKEGAKKAFKLCTKHGGKPLAFLVDGKVFAVPIISPMLDEKDSGVVFLSGRFNKKDLERIVKGITEEKRRK